MKSLFKSFILTIFLLFYLFHPGKVFASEMKIHVINLTNSRGDAVLLQSKNKYLLMDTGIKKSAHTVIHYLKKRKVKHLDIYISHLHDDHYQALPSILANKYFHVHHIYFPSKYGQSSTRAKKLHKRLLRKIRKKRQRFIYLTPGKKLRLGDAVIKILGPVGHYTESKCVNYDDFINSYSMSSMITCGKIKYLSTGDITCAEQEQLIRHYKDYLHADILKASHHGLASCNPQSWLSYINPSYIFASSFHVDEKLKTQVNPSTPVVFTGERNKNIIYHIKDNHISVSYR